MFRKLNRKGLKWNSNADGIDDINSNSHNDNNINSNKDDISNGCNFAPRLLQTDEFMPQNRNLATLEGNQKQQKMKSGARRVPSQKPNTLGVPNVLAPRMPYKNNFTCKI